MLVLNVMKVHPGASLATAVLVGVGLDVVDGDVGEQGSDQPVRNFGRVILWELAEEDSWDHVARRVLVTAPTAECERNVVRGPACFAHPAQLLGRLRLEVDGAYVEGERCELDVPGNELHGRHL